VNVLVNELGTPAKHIYATYKLWAQRTGHQAVSSRTFAQRMESAGKGVTRRSEGRWYPVVVFESEEAES
jgi:hypothetical protein